MNNEITHIQNDYNREQHNDTCEGGMTTDINMRVGTNTTNHKKF